MTIMAGIGVLWVYFLLYIIRSLKKSPLLDSVQGVISDSPIVSVILPARNEDQYIGRCLKSLLAQDYPNFEIIAINDSSTDGTEKIIKEFADNDSRVVYVKAGPKPEGWAGKNWACIEGYRRSTGSILLFTDADTVHATDSIRLAVAQIISYNLDAVSAVPKLVCNDFWTKASLPCLSVFLHSRFSALRVNDPRTKTGYFFGSFYAITRDTYEAVGTHESVKTELVEDGALGAKVKQLGYHMKMVRGERHVHAVWARDLTTLWHGLRRLMIPLFYQDKRNAILLTIAVFFILMEPFIVLPYSILSAITGDQVSVALLILNATVAAIIIVTTSIQCRNSIDASHAFALAAPIGATIISLGFISAIVDARKRDSVVWRERKYTVTSEQHPLP